MFSPPIARRSSSGGLLLAAALALGCGAGCLTLAPDRTVVWIAPSEADVRADTPPSAENDVFSASAGVIRLNSAARETHGLQVVFRGSGGPYDLELSDLVGAARTLASAATTSIFRAHYVRVDNLPAWFSQHTNQPVAPLAAPDLLVPWAAPRGGGPLAPDPSRNEIAWVDLHVPAGTPAGVYVGTLRVRRTGAAAAARSLLECRVELNVLPVELPDADGLPFICRVDPRDVLAEQLRWPRERAEETRLLPSAPEHAGAVRVTNAIMRVLHEHGATPVLWACFPKYRPVGEREVEVLWADYDALVGPWLDGEAPAATSGLRRWVHPVSRAYPDAERNGGFASPQYARLLAGYVAACRAHFADRGWLERSFLRMAEPGELTPAPVDAARRVAGILARGDDAPRLMVHFPAASLRGLGWHNAPAIEVPGVSAWAPRAMWFEPAAMERERALGRETWFIPDHPPYSPSLLKGAPALDPRVLAWQAFRYGVDGVWIESATQCGGGAATRVDATAPAAESLVYPGAPFGMADGVVGSMRLKRIRRGLEDAALLRLAAERGKALLARTVSERVVRWAFTDAALDHLLDTKEAGWTRDSSVLTLARELLLQELANDVAPTEAGSERQIANLAGWGRMMSTAARVATACDGVRLTDERGTLRATALASVTNLTDRPLAGAWSVVDPPPGWQQVGEARMTAPGGGRALVHVNLALAGLAYNADGVYPLVLQFDTDAAGAFAAPARLAVAACLRVDDAPRIDGDLSDWERAASNSAADFRLCRAARTLATAADASRPTLETRAYFCMDRERLYIGVACELNDGEPPVWESDNVIPIDGALPWGQDVIEILIDPVNHVEGTSGDLYCLQIKPSGLIVSRRGALTSPPIGPSEEWRSGAVAKVGLTRRAWVVEIAVPVAALGRTASAGRVWGLNVTRLDARRGEYSSWSGARGYCYSPKRLGNLIIAGP
ncbi:MAG: hypothetical protein AB7Q17_04760 [Phycisphaerae bacterium]